MKLLTTLGRLLAVLFWLAVLNNLITPFAAPFAQLLNLAGIAALLLHLLQLGVCHGRLKASPRPTVDRLLLLVFGAFHLHALPSAEALVERLLEPGRAVEDALEQAQAPFIALAEAAAERNAA